MSFVDGFKKNFKVAYSLLTSKDDDDDEQKKDVHELFQQEEKDENPEKNKTSNLQTFWNIFNANQGVAILTMPYVVKNGGYVGLLSIAAVAFISNFTNKILVRCLYEYEEDGSRYRVRSSYVEIGEAFHPTIGRHLVNFAQIFEQISYCTLLLILCGHILENTFPGSPLRSSHWTAVSALILLPNIFLKSLADVSWVSFVTVVLGQVIYVIVVLFAFWNHAHWNIADVPDFDISDFGVALGIIVVSYSSQPYMPAIEESMKNSEHFDFVINITYIVVTIVKFGFGYVCYLTFSSKTQQVITNNLPRRGGLHMFVNILVLFLSLTSYTIPVFTAFDIVENLDIPCNKTLQSHEDEEIEEKSEESGSSYIERLNVITPRVVRTSLISLTLLIAVMVPHFGLYMALVGNFTGMCLAFIFPAIFHMKINYDILMWYDFIIDVLVLGFGLVGSAVGCHFSVQQLIDAYNLDEIFQ